MSVGVGQLLPDFSPLVLQLEFAGLLFPVVVSPAFALALLSSSPPDPSPSLSLDLSFYQAHSWRTTLRTETAVDDSCQFFYTLQ